MTYPLIPDYLAFTQFTPVIPKLYINAKSPEAGWLEVWKELNKIICYITRQREMLNQLETDFETMKSDTKNQLKSMQKQIDDLTEVNTDDTKIYDVTQGKMTNSVTAMRNLYRELAVFGQRVEDVSKYTVKEASQHSVLETSAIGHYTIDGEHAPRVTPLES